MEKSKNSTAPDQGKTLVDPGPKVDTDLRIAEAVGVVKGQYRPRADRLVFDGYTLAWQGANPASWTAFSGSPKEDSAENIADIGPTPQGPFSIDPADIQQLVPSDDWGSYRIRIVPYRSTVDRMEKCFQLIRTGMYVHGGNVKGTHGCIELNDDAYEKAFFERLTAYRKPIELEVRYVGEREKKFEYAACPYP
ncbi:MAG: hypothetical protein WCC39_12560 [Telluria sp.]